MEGIAYFGKVKSTKDPEGLGRVQVALEGFEETIELPWLRMLSPHASNGFGFLFLPEEGDQVLVLKGHGDDFDGMVVLGCLHHGSAKPAYSNEDGENITKQILTRAGNEITFTDKDGEESIVVQTKEGKLVIKLDQKGVEISISSKDKITVKAEKKFSLESKEVEIKGANKVNIQSDTEVSVKAAQVKVSGDSKVTISAPMVEIG